MPRFSDFSKAIQYTTSILRSVDKPSGRTSWQGIDVSSKPEMRMYETLYLMLDVMMNGEDLDYYRGHIGPNLPWADDHFLERVGRVPINPGEQWKHWPYGHSASNFRHDPVKLGDLDSLEPIFDHNYMQRYWPKFAGHHSISPKYNRPHRGIYFEYGDLDGVVAELLADPGTRQAVLPIFFPEDTGHRPGRRKPCSLFYHFQVSDAGLDVVYSIRSCDFVRHFRDDIYLTARLLLWVLNELRLSHHTNGDPAFWKRMKPGRFIMLIDNLHLFANDRISLFGA